MLNFVAIIDYISNETEEPGLRALAGQILNTQSLMLSYGFVSYLME